MSTDTTNDLDALYEQIDDLQDAIDSAGEDAWDDLCDQQDEVQEQIDRLESAT